MSRGPVGKVLWSLSLTLLMIGLSQSAARAQTKLVKPPGGGSIAIKKPGSYFLAANLSTGQVSFAAISVQANNVTINLNGFSIIGPGGAGTASGINATGHSGVTIANGTITRIAGAGVLFGSNSTLVGVQLINNAGDGVKCTSACLITSDIASGNSGTGLNFSDTTSGYQNNIIAGNGATVTGGTNMGHNVCNGSITCP